MIIITYKINKSTNMTNGSHYIDFWILNMYNENVKYISYNRRGYGKDNRIKKC